MSIGLIVRHDRFGQPLTDIRFPLGLEAAQPIDRQPSRRRDQPRVRVLDGALLCLVPADVRLLHDVLGVGARAGHAIREAEEASADRFEDGYRNLGRIHYPYSPVPRRTTGGVVTQWPR